MTTIRRSYLLSFFLWSSAGCIDDDYVWVRGDVDAGRPLDGSIGSAPSDAGRADGAREVARRPAMLPKPPAPAPPPKPLPPALPSCEVPSEQVLPVTGAAHINGPLDYPDKPPVGGNHNPCWARWGVHERELAAERWVHNLEHGGVVFLFRCETGCATEALALASIVEQNPQAILTPYAALPTRFAAVSWGVRLTSDCFDQARFQRFYDEHVGNGLEQVSSNPPSSCN